MIAHNTGHGCRMDFQEHSNTGRQASTDKPMQARGQGSDTSVAATQHQLKCCWKCSHAAPDETTEAGEAFVRSNKCNVTDIVFSNTGMLAVHRNVICCYSGCFPGNRSCCYIVRPVAICVCERERSPTSSSSCVCAVHPRTTRNTQCPATGQCDPPPLPEAFPFSFLPREAHTFVAMRANASHRTRLKRARKHNIWDTRQWRV
eukprot:363927-Chlamydomonas_euryale.AAC.8